jgi:hypothetical protein
MLYARMVNERIAYIFKDISKSNTVSCFVGTICYIPKDSEWGGSFKIGDRITPEQITCKRLSDLEIVTLKLLGQIPSDLK